MKAFELRILGVLSAVALAAASGLAGAQDNERAPGRSSGVQGPSGASNAGARGGKGTESAVPDTGNPGRTGSAATGKGVPSRDPTASRGQDQEKSVEGRGSTRSGKASGGSDTDRAGGLSGQSVGESVGKGVPAPSPGR